jgi:hypothetical protein
LQFTSDFNYFYFYRLYRLNTIYVLLLMPQVKICINPFNLR